MSSPGFFQKLLKAFSSAGDDKPQASPAKPVSPPPAAQKPVTPPQKPVAPPKSQTTAPTSQTTAPTSQTTAPTSQTTAPKAIDSALFARQCLKLAGGHANVTRIDACVTRVRLTLKDTAKINDDHFKAIGALAVVHVGDKYLQIVVGPKAEEIAKKMKDIPVTDDLANVEVPA